jgi:hypothetical protein
MKRVCNDEYSLYGYECPLCGRKSTFKNSLIFDKWIKNHNCKKESDNR